MPNLSGHAMSGTTDRFRRAAPGLAEAVGLARRLRDEAAGESEEGRAALAWALVNAREGLGARGESEAGDGAAADADFCDPAFCRALATLCLVAAGDISDPTHGATRFHAHDEDPDWARGSAPSALIGRHFFYAPPSSVKNANASLAIRQWESGSFTGIMG